MEKVKNLGWTIIVGQVRTLQCTYNLSAYGLFKLWPTKYLLILRQFRVRKIEMASRAGFSLLINHIALLACDTPPSAGQRTQ